MTNHWKWSLWHGLRIGFCYGITPDGAGYSHGVLACEVHDGQRKASGAQAVNRGDVEALPGARPLFHRSALGQALSELFEAYDRGVAALAELALHKHLPASLEQADHRHWPALSQSPGG